MKDLKELGPRRELTRSYLNRYFLTRDLACCQPFPLQQVMSTSDRVVSVTMRENESVPLLL